MSKIKTMMFTMVALPFAVVAHPGTDHHGGLIDGVVHLFSSADHLLLLLPVILLGGVLLRKKWLAQRNR